jgi:hypothetical protein
MNKATALLAGIGLGGAMMYMLDPDQGNRRRSLVRNRVGHTWNGAGEFMGKAQRDLRNRARGVSSRAASAFRHEEVPEEILEQRVRSKLGRVVTHPRAVEVAVQGARVTLEGEVRAREVQRLMRTVSAVPGVEHVENRLAVLEQDEDVPELQGVNVRGRGRFGMTPAAQLVTGSIGGAILTAWLIRTRPLLLTAALLGTGVLLGSRSLRQEGK